MASHPHKYHAPKAPEGSKKWISFYPAYINKDKTNAEGRRLPKAKCVSTPTAKEITEVLATTGLQIFVENKIYCREVSKEPQYWGKIKVQIKNDEDEIINPKFKCRKDVFRFVGENIPKLKSRTNPKPAQGGAQGGQGKGKKKK